MSNVKGQMSNVGSKGVAALPVTVGILLVVLVVGATLATISFSELFVSKTGKEAKIGFYDAESGVRDALLNVARNAYFEKTEGYSPIGCEKYNLKPDCIDAGCTWTSLDPECQSLLRVWVTDRGDSCTDCPDGCDTYDVPPAPVCGTDNVYKIVCSQMETPSPGIAKKSVISVIKAVVEVSAKGKITECSWEQL